MVVVGDIVYSPVDHGENTASVAGRPRVLVAPNHFHHLALPRYRALYPDVTIVASDVARKRLAAKGHNDVRPLSDARLPLSVRLLPAEGCRTGETWMMVGDTLVVCDAFMNVGEACTGFEGFMLRRLRVVPNLQISRTFTFLAIGDKKTYRRWALDTLEREKPTTMMFAHGAPLRHDQLWQQCAELVERSVR